MKYDTVKLRQFINKHFGPEDLRTFLFDYFRSVYDDLTDGLTKSRQIALLLEYCHKHKKFPDLLIAIQRERPFFQPDDYVQGEKASEKEGRTAKDANSSFRSSDADLDLATGTFFRDPKTGEVKMDTSPVRSKNFIDQKTGKEFVHIPAGEFLFGDDRKKLHLDEFWIAKTPITNAEYAHFVSETKVKPPRHWKGNLPPAELADYPVVYVSWHDAKAYADWAGMKLPTEEQWEKAARGTDGREYPWGNEWRERHCNLRESGILTIIPVGQFSPNGDSMYGCVDMVGNVWEWTASEWSLGSHSPAIRGGEWDNGLQDVRVTVRDYFDPDDRNYSIGFRVVDRISLDS